MSVEVGGPSRYDDNVSIADSRYSPPSAVIGMINQAESLNRSERAAVRKHEAPIFPTTLEQSEPRSSPVSPGLALVFLIPTGLPFYLTLFLVAPPRFLTDTSRGNDKSSRCSDGPRSSASIFI